MAVNTAKAWLSVLDPDHAASGPMAGPIMAAAVLGEIVKTLTRRGVRPEVYFWRTAAGGEVDFLVRSGQRFVPVEVKTTATHRPAMARAIKTLQEDLGAGAADGYLVHTGEGRLPMGRG